MMKILMAMMNMARETSFDDQVFEVRHLVVCGIRSSYFVLLP
jgi:hypothetical protein